MLILPCDYIKASKFVKYYNSSMIVSSANMAFEESEFRRNSIKDRQSTKKKKKPSRILIPTIFGNLAVIGM